MVSRVDCSNLSIVPNSLASKVRLGLIHREKEKLPEHGGFHGDDCNPLHNFDDTCHSEEFAIRAIPPYHSVADVKLFVSYIYFV